MLDINEVPSLGEHAGAILGPLARRWTSSSSRSASRSATMTAPFLRGRCTGWSRTGSLYLQVLRPYLPGSLAALSAVVIARPEAARRSTSG